MALDSNTTPEQTPETRKGDDGLSIWGALEADAEADSAGSKRHATTCATGRVPALAYVNRG